MPRDFEVDAPVECLGEAWREVSQSSFGTVPPESKACPTQARTLRDRVGHHDLIAVRPALHQVRCAPVYVEGTGREVGADVWVERAAIAADLDIESWGRHVGSSGAPTTGQPPR